MKLLARWEVERIKSRIEKAERRISSGYELPDKRGETEEARRLRLLALLEQAS